MQSYLCKSRWIAFALDQIKVVAHIDGFRQKNESSTIFRIEEISWFIFDHHYSTVEGTWTTWPCFSNTTSKLWTCVGIFNYWRCKISQPDFADTLRLGRWTQQPNHLKNECSYRKTCLLLTSKLKVRVLVCQNLESMGSECTGGLNTHCTPP